MKMFLLLTAFYTKVIIATKVHPRKSMKLLLCNLCSIMGCGGV